MANLRWKPVQFVIGTLLVTLFWTHQAQAASIVARVPFGGSGNDTAFRAAVTDDAIFIAGVTASEDFPLVNPVQSTFGGDPNGIGDMFIVKLDKTTREILFSTYLGGSGSDLASGIVVDLNGNIIVSGWSDSTDFPVTGNAQQPENAGKSDGIIVIFNPQLELIYASFLGGPEEDQLSSVDLTSNTFLFDGSFIVVGISNGTGYPVTPGLDENCSSCGISAVVTAINIADGSIKWSLFLGGSTSGAIDVALAVKVFGSVAYVVGYTEDPDFPRHPFDTHKGGKDIFLTTFDISDGDQRFSTIRGGLGDDIGNAVDVGNGSNIYIGGSTTSEDFPTTAGSADFAGGITDAFLMRVNAEGGTVFPFTILMGGSGDDQVRSVIFENFSRVHVGGVTSSHDLPVLDPIQDSFGGGATDSFTYTINNNTGLLEAGTYLGGSGDDGTTGGGLFNPNSTDEKKETLYVGGTSSNLGSGKAEDAEVTIVSPKPKKKFDLEVTTLSLNTQDLTEADLLVVIFTIKNNGPDESVGLTVQGKFPRVQYLIVPGENTFSETAKKGAENVEFQGVAQPLANVSFELKNSTILLNPGEQVEFEMIVTYYESNYKPHSFEIEVIVEDENSANNKKNITTLVRGEATNVGGTAIAEKQDTIGDPITSSNGAFIWNQPLIDLGGPAQLKCELIYRSDLNHIVPNTMLPHFWWSPYATLSARAPLNGKIYTAVQLPNGDIVSFKMSESGWVPVDNEEDVGFTTFTDNATPTPYVLKEQNNWFYFQDVADEKVYLFEDFGSFTVLRSIVNRNGNRLSFNYDNGAGNSPTSVHDGLGRQLSFTYQGFGTGLQEFLTTITDQGGRTWTLNYEDAGSDNQGLPTLRSITDPLDQTTLIHYSSESIYSDLVESIQRPNGNIPYRQTYGAVLNGGLGAARVLEQSDAFDQKRTLAFDPDLRVVTVTEPDTGIWQYESFGHHAPSKSIIDPNGKSLDFTRNGHDQITSLKDREDQTWTFEYHSESGQMNRIVNPLNQETSFTYQENINSIVNPSTLEEIDFNFYDLIRVDLPGGAFEIFEYDTVGNLTAHTDEGGHTTEHVYNSFGQRTKTVLPTGGEILNEYDAAGNLISTNDSAKAPSTYEYDALNRRITIQLPDEVGDPGATRRIAYDAMNRITSVTDEKGNQETYQYDANGNRTAITDRAGNTMQFEYDAMDRLVRVTDREGAITEYGYDTMGRLSTLDAPDQVTRVFEYDTLGNRVQAQDGNRTTAFDYDSNRRLIAADYPLNRTVAYEYDAIGNTTKFTDSVNQSRTLDYDPRSKLIESTNPLGESTRYEYDAVENLVRNTHVDSQDQPLRAARFEYDESNRLTHINDSNRRSWLLMRSPEERITQFKDPLNQQTDYQYDPQGRLKKIIRPDASEVDFEYDVSGNTTRIAGTDGTAFDFQYDALDYWVATDQVQLVRDKENRITDITRFDIKTLVAYDAADRIISIQHPDLGFTVQYEYDAVTGFLSRISDNLSGGFVDYSYDDAGRLVGESRGNGVNTLYEYDAADRLVHLQHGTILDLHYTWGAADRIQSIDMDSPLLPDLESIVGNSRLRFDQASQVQEQNYQYDASGRRTAQPDLTFQWNTLELMTAANDVQFEYDGLGNLVTMQTPSLTTTFVRNDALPGTPVSVEATGGGLDVKRFYVWTPDGRLIYSVTPSDSHRVHYYHFDHAGSTLGLSTDTGDFTDFYTYSPYGVLLNHQGNSDQPFDYSGQFGVQRIPLNNSASLLKTQARFYDPDSGTFLSREPLWPDVFDLELLNPYQYGKNSPLLFVDPDGLTPLTARERHTQLNSIGGSILGDISEHFAREEGIGFSGLESNTAQVGTVKYRIEQIKIYIDIYIRSKGIITQDLEAGLFGFKEFSELQYETNLSEKNPVRQLASLFVPINLIIIQLLEEQLEFLKEELKSLSKLPLNKIYNKREAFEVERYLKGLNGKFVPELDRDNPIELGDGESVL